MAERVQKQRETQQRDTSLPAPIDADSKQELKDDLDDILDEIDEVLEQNAEEFVAAYVQKGGE